MRGLAVMPGLDNIATDDQALEARRRRAELGHLKLKLQRA